MDFENMKKIVSTNKILIMIIGLSCVVLMGGSYAWYTINVESNKVHTMKVGTLELELKGKEEQVIINKAVPQKDSEGIKNTPYHFTVTNTGNLSTKYNVYLEDISLSSGATRLSDSVIKYNLANDKENNTQYLNSLQNISGKRLLITGTLKPEESITYDLRLWLAEEATSEIAGEEFIAKITIEGGQTNRPIE
ncbi:MAG: hypothetical protein HFJ38_05385 [Bacilli bacterium]|nr:hypothetical protein [Bacilli bacterium]